MNKDSITKEIRRLKESLENFEKILGEQKEKFKNFITNASYKQINSLENSQEYSNLLTASQIVADINTQIRCLEWALKS